jgi:hypothetical protein
MVRAALGYLAVADATQLGAAAQARYLKAFEQADAIGTAARASFLAAFTAGQGYGRDAVHAGWATVVGWPSKPDSAPGSSAPGASCPSVNEREAAEDLLRRGRSPRSAAHKGFTGKAFAAQLADRVLRCSSRPPKTSAPPCLRSC